MSRLSAFAALNNSDSDSENESVQTTNTPVNPIMAIDLGLGTGSAAYGSISNQYVSILASNFILTEENTQYREDHVLIGMQSTDVLVVKGQYKLSIVQGSVLIDSFVLNNKLQELTINASNLNSLPCFRTNGEVLISNLFETPFSCIIRLTNYDDKMSNVAQLYPHFKNLYSSDQISKNNSTAGYTFTVLSEPEPNRVATSISDSWNYYLNNLSNTLGSGSVVLIIGNKNTGKSTFLKLLANSLLCSNTECTLQVLDMDPGQPEFCLPGCISLSTIRKPILGTIQSYDAIAETDVRYYGFTSPNIQPLNYLYQLDGLLDKINESKNTITLINSPGWVKGFGAEIISHLNDSLRISQLVQLSEELRDLTITREIEWRENDTEILKLPSISNSNPYPPLFIRNFKLLSYMHYDFALGKYDFNPLVCKSPYRVSYSSVSDVGKLSTFGGIIGVSVYDSQGMSIVDVPQSLECQYMALMTVPVKELEKLGGGMRSMANYPNVINETSIKSVTTKFHGLCVVHSVDVCNHTINLYTPIDVGGLATKLSTNIEKLVLVKGREEVPMDEIYSPQIVRKCAYWSNFGISCPPFVSESMSNEVAGGKTVGIRRNIQRR